MLWVALPFVVRGQRSYFSACSVSFKVSCQLKCIAMLDTLLGVTGHFTSDKVVLKVKKNKKSLDLLLAERRLRSQKRSLV